MTVQSRAQILDLITSALADNSTRDISEADIRAVTMDIADSAVFPSDLATGDITPVTGDLDLNNISGVSGAEVKALYEAEADTNAFSDEYVAALNDLISRPEYSAPANEFLIGHPDGSGDIASVAGDVALARISDALLASDGIVSGTFDLVMSTATPVYSRTLTGNATLDSISGASLGQAVFLDLVQDAVEEYTFGVNAANFDVPASGLDNDLTASSITRYWIRPLITGKHIIRRITEVA